MKRCPHCKMIVEGHTECPMCHTDIQQEPYLDVECERYRFNKYFFKHILKYHKFPFICLIIVIIKTILSLSSFNRLYLVALLLSTYSVILSLYMKKFIAFYARHVMKFHVISVICAIVIIFGDFLNYDDQRIWYGLVLFWIAATIALAFFMRAFPSSENNNVEDYSELINKIVKYVSGCLSIYLVFFAATKLLIQQNIL